MAFSYALRLAGAIQLLYSFLLFHKILLGFWLIPSFLLSYADCRRSKGMIKLWHMQVT